MIKYAEEFLRQNFYYVYLKGRLEKGSKSGFKNGTLIVGSSHALFGVYEGAWREVVNCSMHSQDIYYDGLCIKNVIDHMPKTDKYSDCILIMGYYMPFQDLSMAKKSRDELIARTYYPIFQDAHNWQEVSEYDHWNFCPGLDAEEKKIYEREAIDASKHIPFFSDRSMKRKPRYDFGGRRWFELSRNEKEYYGMERAMAHNQLENHKASYDENMELLKDIRAYLHDHDIRMTVIVSPFSGEYMKNVSESMKEAFFEMMSCAEVPVVIDFNRSARYKLFDESCFMDMDHLNDKGGRLFSEILVKEMEYV